jgi:hypothetical protein
MSKKIDPQAVIPEYLDGINVSNRKELIYLGKPNLRNIKRYWKRKERESIAEIEALQAKIKMSEGKDKESLIREKIAAIEMKKMYTSFILYIARVVKDAENKPLFFFLRSWNQFRIGDKVVFFTGTHSGAMWDFQNKFIGCKVLKKRRSHENFKIASSGSISVLAGQQVRDINIAKQHKGRELRGYICSPGIMKRWEYNYLKKHPDYLKFWLQFETSLSSRGHYYDVTNLREAFAEN